MREIEREKGERERRNKKKKRRSEREKHGEKEKREREVKRDGKSIWSHSLRSWLNVDLIPSKRRAKI